ncbi:MAG TPA: PAS domain S-box protein [Allosphingosinicella sp.]|jgi:PAS domain S-box-containing protein|nr:PAS domain S-box protein [Allosphingosinicella sp.]
MERDLTTAGGRPGTLPMPPGGPGSAAVAHDWSASPLGPMDSWPQPLKTAANIVLTSNIPMLLVWGPDLLTIHNDSYGEILGDRRPALGRPIREVWSDHWDVIGPITDRVLGGETVFLDSARRTLKRGGREESAWLTACYNPVFDEEGEAAGILGVVTSVSEDERTQQRLRESEERFRLIADSAPVLMWVTQLDRRRSFVNRAYVDFLNITYEQAVDFDWRTIIHPEDADRILHESIAGEASLKTFVLVGRFRGGDGEWHWVRSVSQPRWGPGGEHIGFIGVAHDITENKLAEERLREMNETLERRVEERTADLRAALERLREEVAERERAEQALRQAQKMEAVGRLTGGIAHDFNNLLTPVIGGLEILASTLEEPRLKRLAEAALESGRRGAKLTGQLLTFSRIQRIRISPVAVNQVIDNLRHILRHTIGSGVSIRTELSQASAHAMCDENQLENAILNLAINARDAMPEGGTLTISTGVVYEAGEPDLDPGEYVCISVADTGIGMPPDVAARATEPFFSTKPFGKGTGLGLAQVYGIARQSGGTLRIDSKEGEGTDVRVLLPSVEPAAAAAEAGEILAEAEQAPQGPFRRIMVIDDDADVRFFVTELLESHGHKVEAFAHPQAAIDAIGASACELALIDFAMPGMNGAQLARELRRARPDLPVAFVTGYAETEQLESALGRDVPVLRKPFGMDELIALVAAALEKPEPPKP